MVASKYRVRFPCFVGGVAAVTAGGFMLASPILDSIQPLGWMWFCLWIASLPILAACAFSLVVLTTRDKKLLAVTVVCIVAVIANIIPTLSFLSAARL